MYPLSQKLCYMSGFVPTAEVLLFWQKDPKPFSPCRGPSENVQKALSSKAEGSEQSEAYVSTLRAANNENATGELFQHSPTGSLCGSPTPAAAQLAALKQCSPKTPESAALLGHAKGEDMIKCKKINLFLFSY